MKSTRGLGQLSVSPADQLSERFTRLVLQLTYVIIRPHRYYGYIQVPHIIRALFLPVRNIWIIVSVQTRVCFPLLQSHIIMQYYMYILVIIKRRRVFIIIYLVYTRQKFHRTHLFVRISIVRVKTSCVLYYIVYTLCSIMKTRHIAIWICT